jgi:hypothetical protein
MAPIKLNLDPFSQTAVFVAKCQFLYEIWGSQSGEDIDVGFLIYNAL